MCDHCDPNPDVRERASKEAERLSLTLKNLALFYAGVASGRIKPHTNEYVDQSIYARQVIRRLIEEWV